MISGKFGYIKATVDFALERPELQDQVREYFTTWSKLE